MLNAPGGLVASLRPGREPGVAKASLSFASDPLAYDRQNLEAQRRLLNPNFPPLWTGRGAGLRERMVI